MLQQIIRDMYIDPDLLAELSEEQKQILFCKMREEQVRRYKLEQEKNAVVKQGIQRKAKVKFLLGKDNKPWTWVMGEHQEDETIEQILEKEQLEKARRLAQQEAEQRAKEEAIRLEKQKAEDDRIAREKARLEAERKKKQEEAAIYATLKQAKLEAQMEKERKEKERQMAELLEQEKKRKIQMEKEEKESKSREEDLRKKWQLRAQEIYQRGKQKRERNNKDAETESKQTDEFWKEQQEKSKIADRHRSERAKQARRSLRMSVDYSTLGMPGVVEQAMQQNLHKPKPALPPRPQKTRPDRPRNRRDITEWFLEVEKPKMTGIDPKTNRPAKWFHGIIKRSVAEDLLMSKQVGTFLVRISERVWGYVISYKDEDRCKHFLIDASDNTYQFFGANQIAHETLNDLVNYHKKNPISTMENEVLITDCGQDRDPPDYAELYGQWM